METRSPSTTRDCGALAQLVERLLCKQEVRGSIPLGSTLCSPPLPSCGRVSHQVYGHVLRRKADVSAGVAARSPGIPEWCELRHVRVRHREVYAAGEEGGLAPAGVDRSFRSHRGEADSACRIVQCPDVPSIEHPEGARIGNRPEDARWTHTSRRRRCRDSEPGRCGCVPGVDRRGEQDGAEGEYSTRAGAGRGNDEGAARRQCRTGGAFEEPRRVPEVSPAIPLHRRPTAHRRHGGSARRRRRHRARPERRAR